MKKEKLIKLINKGYSQRKIATELNTSQGNVRYWLKKFEIKTKNIKVIVETKNDEKYCSKCKLIKKRSEFYKKESGDGLRSQCKKCRNKTRVDKTKVVKEKMVLYKGGECEKHEINFGCKLKLKDTSLSIFDFHHIDPNDKDINFKYIKYQTWDKIKEEIDKCILLCSNCHRIEHWG